VFSAIAAFPLFATLPLSGITASQPQGAFANIYEQSGALLAITNSLGMTPLSRNIIGIALGILMLLVMYIFIKNMFGITAAATCGTLLLGFDFMRYVQSNVAMADIYAVTFILLAYFFMYRYVTVDVDAPIKKGILPLALSGFFFGLSLAAMWVTVFAVIGLKLIMIIKLAGVAKHYRLNKKRGYGAYLVKTDLLLLLFFGIVPAILICLSYISYGIEQGMTLQGGMLTSGEYYRSIISNLTAVFSYHYTPDAAQLTPGAAQQFSSVWWQWILNSRPVLFFDYVFGATRTTVASFGNPVVWWGGIAAMLVMAVRVFSHRDNRALMILIGYLASVLPWVLATRPAFIYQYFPATLFIVLALAHIFSTILDLKRERCNAAVYSFTIATGLVFALFYPAMTGIYMSSWYFGNLLRWIPGLWPF